VFKSSNAGASWATANNGLSNLIVRNVLVSPDFAVDQTVFAHTYVGIFRSSNGGASWTLVAPGYAFRCWPSRPTSPRTTACMRA